MRDSKSKTKKTTPDTSDENSGSLSLQMEMELLAVKAKNADLIKAHTKLVQENAELKSINLSLQTEIVDLQGRFNSVESSLKYLRQNMKKCTPNLIDVLNLFLQVEDGERSVNSQRSSDRGLTPKARAVTHTVKPHTVNGTVLNLVPTISLQRLNTMNTSPVLNNVSSNRPISDYRNSVPSTSAGENIPENENFGSDLNNSDAQNRSFVNRRSTKSTSDEHMNGFMESADDDADESEEPSSDESDHEEVNMKRLSTITEESTCSSGRKRTSLGEIRIYLSRLSNEDMCARRSHNTSITSTEGNVNDTCLNIETTVIENSDDRVSKRLKADIMVFSPGTNSTRMEDENSIFGDLSPMGDRKKISIPEVSSIQSPEVTPSTNEVNENDEPVSTNMSDVPTPSMSALGDIDASTTKLEILRELGLEPTALIRGTATANDSENTLVPQSATPKRRTRSSNRNRTRNGLHQDDESSRGSIENQNENLSVKTFVNRRRGASGDRPLTPTIILERLENVMPERRLTASAVNIQILAPSDEPNENENPPRKTGMKPKKKRMRTRSKSPKRTGKRKIKQEPEDRDSGSSLRDKIREIQIRLSNYVPENDEEPFTEGNSRPKRAARPTTLKDASLKVKLRRMV